MQKATFYISESSFEPSERTKHEEKLIQEVKRVVLEETGLESAVVISKVKPTSGIEVLLEGFKLEVSVLKDTMEAIWMAVAFNSDPDVQEPIYIRFTGTTYHER